MPFIEDDNATIARMQKEISQLQAQIASLNNAHKVIYPTNPRCRVVKIENNGRQQDLEDLMDINRLNRLLQNHKGDVKIIIDYKNGITSDTVVPSKTHDTTNDKELE
jgi:hypothetical protein